MAETLELLRQSPVFADLPNDQIDWFLSQSREVELKAGGVYARQGDPADAMFVLLEGQFQWRGRSGRCGPVAEDHHAVAFGAIRPTQVGRYLCGY